MNTTDLPARLRAWRAAAGLSQSEAALALGVKFPSFVGWESGRRTPDPWKLKALGEAMERVLAAKLSGEKGNEQ